MGELLCLVSLVGVMLTITGVSSRFRWKTVDYITAKSRNPSLKPPKHVKIGNSIIRFFTLAIAIGLGGVILYGFISAGQLMVASIVGILLILVTIAIALVGSYWKNNFDL